MANNDDLSQIPPLIAVRSISAESISNKTSRQRIIGTEPITLSSTRSNSIDSVRIDFDRPPTTTRNYIPSRWAISSTSTATPRTTTATPIVNSESISRQTSVSVTRVLPIQFTENNKIPITRSPPPPPPVVSPLPPPPSVLSTTTTRTIETNIRVEFVIKSQGMQ